MERQFNDQELAKREKLKKMVNEGNDPFLVQKFSRNYNSQSFKNEFDVFSKEELHENATKILIAGRVMAIRQTFGVLKDFYGKVQFYINKKTISPKVWQIFDTYLDVGDIIGIEGKPMKTNSGEVTVRVDDMIILSKSLKPLPEKFHGLVDEEEKRRKRHLDLLMNENSVQTFVIRSKLTQCVRQLLINKGFFEVDTPILQPQYGGAAAKPFSTHFNALDKNVFLRIAPELYLKRLIVGGFEKVFEFSRNFRNEGIDTTHNPEFTVLEHYSAYDSLEEVMDLTEEIYHECAKMLNKDVYKFRGFDIDLSKPFRKISMVDLIKEAIGIDFNTIKSDEQAIELAKQHHIDLEEHQKKLGHIIALFFEKYGEPLCIQPTFVHTHPVATSPLTKRNPNNPNFVDRFELFIAQKEAANAYSELNNPIEQLQRFEEQLLDKAKGNSEN
jgi:lysyl-tRNA synthetase class 2